jgi:hypothetical protein
MTTTTATATRPEVIIDTAIAEASEALYAARRNAEIVKNRRTSTAADIEAAEAAVAAAEIEQGRRSSQYTGWSRFFLVTSSANGHIHTDRRCSTCRWNTQYGWLPELSGSTEADAVEEYGSILCSVCFPSAPVEWTNGTNKKVAAEKALHEALKQIERSPEGRKVKAAAEKVSTLRSQISNYQYEIKHAEECIADGLDYFANRLATAQERIVKAEKALPKAEARLAQAQADLAAALAG